MSFWALTILDVTVKTTLLFGAGALAAATMRRASASARHAVWTTAVVGALAAPALSLLLPHWSAPVLTAPFELADATSYAHETPRTPVDRSRALAPVAPDATQSLAIENLRLRSVSGDAQTTGAPTSPRLSLSEALLLVWMCGVVAVLGRLLIGSVAVYALTRRASAPTGASWHALAAALAAAEGLSGRVRFLRGDHATMPMTWGVVSPRVLMPAEADHWAPERQRVVLLHELAHVRRLDYLTQTLAQLACALYWFNPLAWTAARRLRIEREHACDDLVLDAGTDAPDYATHLLDLARSLRTARFPAAAAVGMADRSQLEGRLIAILDPGVRRAAPQGPARAVAVAAACSIVAIVATLHVWASPQTAGPPAMASLPTVIGAGLEPVASAPQASPARALASPQPPPVAGPSASPLVTPAPDSDDDDDDDVQASAPVVTPQPFLHIEPSLDALAALAVNGAHIASQLLNEPGIQATTPEPKPRPEAQGDPRAVEALITALQDKDADVRAQAAIALSSFRDPRAAPSLSRLVKDPNADVRQQAIFALGSFRDPAHFDVFVAAMKDEAADVRQQAAFALGNLRDKRAIPALIDALKDPKGDVRQQAVSGLGDLRDPSTFDALLAALKDADDDVREQAAHALGNLRDRRAVGALTALLKDADDDVREQAVFALGSLRDPASLDALVAALKDARPSVRGQAAFALGQMRDPRTIDALTAMLRDEDAEVRRQAVFALGQAGKARKSEK